MTRAKKPDSHYQQTSYSSKKLTKSQAIKEKIDFLKPLPNYRYCNNVELRQFAHRYLPHDVNKRLVELIE